MYTCVAGDLGEKENWGEVTSAWYLERIRRGSEGSRVTVESPRTSEGVTSNDGPECGFKGGVVAMRSSCIGNLVTSEWMYLQPAHGIRELGKSYRILKRV